MSTFLEDPQHSEVPAQARTAIRTALMVSAVSGIVLGIVALFWPGPTLLAIAIVFGLWLVVSGIMRVATAASSSFLSSGKRWLVGILGAIVFLIGIVCLFNPGGSLVVLAIFIGISWILDGITALFSGRDRATVGPRWLYVLGSIVSVVAGIIVLALPGVAIVTFAVFGGIMLIIVGIVTLCTLPPKVDSTSADGASRDRVA